jgi:Na+-transporting NADH:ubiquinone oxidoreductase subunit NqrE
MYDAMRALHPEERVMPHGPTITNSDGSGAGWALAIIVLVAVTIYLVFAGVSAFRGSSSTDAKIAIEAPPAAAPAP